MTDTPTIVIVLRQGKVVGALVDDFADVFLADYGSSDFPENGSIDQWNLPQTVKYVLTGTTHWKTLEGAFEIRDDDFVPSEFKY